MSRRLLREAACALAAISTLLALAPEAGAQRPSWSLVSIGSRSLEARVVGTGTRTVVLEAGFDGDFSGWQRTIDSLDTEVRVLMYRRAGFGRSSPPDSPQTGVQIADDLASLLRALQIEEPITLVAHSAGGMYARVFAYRYPSRLSGMVLVDPATEEAYRFAAAVDTAAWEEAVRSLRALGNAGLTAHIDGLAAAIADADAAWPLPTVPIVVLSARKVSEWPLGSQRDVNHYIEAHRALVRRTRTAAHRVLDEDHGSILASTELLASIRELVRPESTSRPR